MADKIEIVDYDPRWPEQFDALAKRARAALGTEPAVTVEHIGSTSVPGLAAKPVIDWTIVVPTRDDIPEAVARLATLGYVHEGDKGVAGREAFHWPPGEARHHMYVCAEGNAELRRHRLFRDCLRANPDEAGCYADLKRRLAAQFDSDRVAYNNGKTEFVTGILARLTDDIALTDYNPNWPQRFETEAARVRDAVGPNALAVEHFGSTSIPNLPAKPIIDILVLVRSVADACQDAVSALEALGYAFWYDNPDAAHLFFVKGLPPNGPRTHHVHIVEADYPDAKLPGFRFADRLLFRDALRADSNAAARYAALKRDLASRFPDDREAYTEAKGEFVRDVMARSAPSPSSLVPRFADPPPLRRRG